MKTLSTLALVIAVNALFCITILVPDNPSSLPVITAADKLLDFNVKIFQNHTQAHSLFLSGKNLLILTGYAVGESFANRGVPIKLAASYVKGLNYLITDIPDIDNFSQLKGEKIYFPFKGSPIEKMSIWLAEQDGLKKEELNIGYLPFNSMIDMMKKGEVHAAVMPVSAAMMIAGKQGFYYAINLDDKWEQITNSDFYPQLGLFYNTQKLNIADIKPLLNEIAKAVDSISQNPDFYVNKYKDLFSIDEAMLRKSLEKIKFEMFSEFVLEEKMDVYFEKSGIKPPPDSFYKINK